MIQHAQHNQWHFSRRELRAALGQHLRSIALVMVVLCFALAEPLACVLHCQVYVPWLLHQQHSQPHTHAAHIHDPALQPVAPAAHAASLLPGTVQISARPSNGAAWCFYASAPSNSPTGQFVPPSPVHEVVLVNGFALPLLMLMRVLAAHLPLLPPSYVASPPTPPPRLPTLS